MAVERIGRKIMADAEAEVSKIEAEAEAGIDALRVETIEAIGEIERKARDEADREAREEKRRIVSKAKAEMRKELLGEKQALIDQTFRGALTSLLQLTEKEYVSLMKKLFLKSVEVGDEEVIVSSQNERVNWNQVISEVNGELSAQGRKGQLALSQETRSLSGGFVLRRGKKEINCALELIVGSMREELEFEVAEALFPTSSSSVS